VLTHELLVRNTEWGGHLAGMVSEVRCCLFSRRCCWP